MGKFLVQEVESRPGLSLRVGVVSGDAYACCETLLPRLTLGQLHRLSGAVVAEARGRVARASEQAADDAPMDDVVTPTGLVPPFVVDGAECDEDGDEVLEPTPVVRVEP